MWSCIPIKLKSFSDSIVPAQPLLVHAHEYSTASSIQHDTSYVVMSAPLAGCEPAWSLHQPHLFPSYILHYNFWSTKASPCNLRYGLYHLSKTGQLPSGLTIATKWYGNSFNIRYIIMSPASQVSYAKLARLPCYTQGAWLHQTRYMATQLYHICTGIEAQVHRKP